MSDVGSDVHFNSSTHNSRNIRKRKRKVITYDAHAGPDYIYDPKRKILLRIEGYKKKKLISGEKSNTNYNGCYMVDDNKDDHNNKNDYDNKDDINTIDTIVPLMEDMTLEDKRKKLKIQID